MTGGSDGMPKVLRMSRRRTAIVAPTMSLINASSIILDMFDDDKASVYEFGSRKNARQ